MIDEGLAEKHSLLRRYEELSTVMAEANASDMDALLRLLFVCLFFVFFFSCPGGFCGYVFVAVVRGEGGVFSLFCLRDRVSILTFSSLFVLSGLCACMSALQLFFFVLYIMLSFVYSFQ